MLAEPAANQHRSFCFSCHRTAALCLCPDIPVIQNEIPLLILQHRRERRHAFNTVRLLERALGKLDVIVGYREEFAKTRLPLRSSPALLYPSADAPRLADLSMERLPNQLVLLDGTWHHAKTFVRDISALAQLPTYRLDPPVAARFRIRREPTRDSLSTLEAAAQALQTLEPELAGLDELISAFDTMVQRQLDHPSMKSNWRRKRRRFNSKPKLPPELGDASRIVVAYGEAEPRSRDGQDKRRLPVCWMAQRLNSGKMFSAFLQSRQAMDDYWLRTLQLDGAEFASAIAPEEFSKRWQRFLHPNDIVAVYNQGTSGLLSALGIASPTIVLKPVCANIDQRVFPSLSELLADKRLAPEEPTLPGRAGQRLADTVALVRYLINRYAR